MKATITANLPGTWTKYSWIIFVALVLALFPIWPASAQSAPDASDFGLFPTASAEYQLLGIIDPDVALDREIDLWARVYYPVNLNTPPHPVLVFLHGNHGTCGHPSTLPGNPRDDDNIDYTFLGTCPEGYVVTPNHLGYGYLAERLASHGYVVVSINANRGITVGNPADSDDNLILARARLVLTHLKHLRDWNATAGSTPPSLGIDLKDKLDLTKVGLLGHSRGGEGMRAAYNMYNNPTQFPPPSGSPVGANNTPWKTRIPGLKIKGIFEIAPVDGQTDYTLNAEGVVWNVLLPMCDGDVSDLQGIKPFDRMLKNSADLAEVASSTQKSSYTVWGANHNFFNTEWQISDSEGCTGHTKLFEVSPGSAKQRLTALSSVLAFFLGNIGETNATLNQNFNPLAGLPSTVVDETKQLVQYCPSGTCVERGYTPTPNALITPIFEDFSLPTGKNSHNVPNNNNKTAIEHINLSTEVPEHSPVQKAAKISWIAGQVNPYFQTNWTAANKPGVDISLASYQTLDMRLSRKNDPLNQQASTDFSIRLVGSNGISTRPVKLSQYLNLQGPVGGPGGLHAILETARIPLSDFGNFSLVAKQVRGIRLSFDRTASGAIYVADIRFSKTQGPGASTIIAGLSATLPGTSSPLLAESSQTSATPMNAAPPISYQGAITAIRRLSDIAKARLPNGIDVEIEVYSDQAFTVGNNMYLLRIGSQEFKRSRYGTSNLKSLVFYLSADEFAQLSNNEGVSIQNGRHNPSKIWNLGRLDKSILSNSN